MEDGGKYEEDRQEKKRRLREALRERKQGQGQGRSFHPLKLGWNTMRTHARTHATGEDTVAYRIAHRTATRTYVLHNPLTLAPPNTAEAEQLKPFSV